MQWQLGREMGTIPAFASRTQENQENLGLSGREDHKGLQWVMNIYCGLRQNVTTSYVTIQSTDIQVTIRQPVGTEPI